MKGVVLAGGTGTRLRPITYAEPKQTLPVANIPVLVRAIRDLRATGIDEVCIVLGDNGRSQVKRTIESRGFDVTVTYVVQGPARGLADAIRQTREFVGTDPFVVHFGDVVLGGNVQSLVNSFDPVVEAARLGTYPVSEPSEHAIVEVEDGRAIRVHEKPEDPPGTRSPVIDAFTPEIFDAIDAITPSDRGELEIIDAIQLLIDDGAQVGVTALPGWWRDTGTPDGFLEANRLLLEDADGSEPDVVPAGERIEGPETLASGARIARESAVVGPASLADSVVIEEGATVGPRVSVGPDSVISSATIEDSVLCSDVKVVTDRRITGSILPRGVRVDTATDGCRLLVSRDTEISL